MNVAGVLLVVLEAAMELKKDDRMLENLRGRPSSLPFLQQKSPVY